MKQSEALKSLRLEAKKLGYTFKPCNSSFNNAPMWAMYSRESGHCLSVKASLKAWGLALQYGVIAENTGEMGMGYIMTTSIYEALK